MITSETHRIKHFMKNLENISQAFTIELEVIIYRLFHHYMKLFIPHIWGPGNSTPYLDPFIHTPCNNPTPFTNPDGHSIAANEGT